MELDQDRKEKLRQLVTDVAAREGVLLYDLEFSGARGRILRVLIDKKDASVSVDECANVSRALNLLLDVEDLIPGGAYDLEVSSPGLERKLIAKWHYETALSHRIRVKLAHATKWREGESEIGGALQTVEGILSAVGEQDIELHEGDRFCRIPWTEILRAQMVFRPEVNGKKR